MQLTKNFIISEFNCHDGTAVPKKLMPNILKLANNLQVLRDYFGKPILLNSGYRTKAYNKKVGGEKDSYHLLAMASDIRIDGVSPKEVKKTIEKLIKEGKMEQGGIGLYATFVHYDIRGYKARW